MDTILSHMVVAALSTVQTVGIVALLWMVVIVVVAVHQIVHRRRESSRQAERLDTLRMRTGTNTKTEDAKDTSVHGGRT